jgi:hypothetical protein
MQQQGRVQPQRHVLRSKLHRFLGPRDVQRLRPRPRGSQLRLAVRYRYDEAEMMVQDQSLVPADTSATSGATCHHGPRRSSAPARARRSSTSRSCSNRRGAMTGASAAYATGSVPLLQRRKGGGGGPRGGHPAEAGRRCCRVVEQGAAVGQVLMWWRKKATRNLSAPVVNGSWFSRGT